MAAPNTETEVRRDRTSSETRDLFASSEDERSALKETCEDDRCQAPNARVWHCVDCDSNYCNDCWGYQGPHKAGKIGRDGVPHERTNVAIVSRLRAILQPPQSLDEIKQSHERDQPTKWFGVARDVTGRPSLEDYGRYATLMGSIQPLDINKDRYPQLVSFIGVTNAGKSTIIKMLVNHALEGSVAPKMFPTPVAGSIANEKVPTSGDVHLYADQSTHAGQLPILYADCEGFEGGEKMPLGARIKKRPCSSAAVAHPELAQSRSLPIEWANTEESRQREFAVRELYPRLLYTFSDVVVFVLRNPKTFQSAVLGKLLEWGSSALEKSINQPSLPHAIVLLNDTEPGVDEREWDTDFATQSLLSCVAGALDYVEGVPRFRELAEYWRGLGKQVVTIQDLILRYYSSFKVMRMPRKPRYTLMDRQIGRLHQEIRADCNESLKAKRKARMLTNSDELNIYLQSAFEHFTRTLTTPFNFVAVSLLANPISYDFGGHILQLANTVAALRPAERQESGLSQWIFEKMCLIVASCVMLDCARYRKGRVEDLLESYKKFFDWVLQEYCDMWLPCSYSNGEGRRCQLVKARHHTKGHQDGQGIIAHGDYQSSFTAEEYGPVWERQLRASISFVQGDLQRHQEQYAQGGVLDSDEKIALRLHRQNIYDFYAGIGDPQDMISHSTCFCCLMEVPEHPLPCGHVLCSACVQAYGKSANKCIVEMAYCPMHMNQTRWSNTHQIKFKHKAAGTRVLCLDGGGIRGIVELEVLRAIEEVLGGEIPIQAFFDLIVGTSTGGIIALALGVQQWPVDRCISMFTSLCNHAYTPRVKGMPILDLAATISHGSKYKTKAFHEALKDAFGDQDVLFGGRGHSKSNCQTRVAVTSTTSTGSKAIVLANYRRKEDAAPEYDFERPHQPELEMRVWEAAAATSSAPTYFKPFVNPLTRRTYLDGALHNNNPARVANRERKLIWPEASDSDPDILLSLGTGQNRISILPKLSAKTTDWKTLQSSLRRSNSDDLKGFRRYLRSWTVLYNRVDDILNAEMAWAAFRADVISTDVPFRNTRRYIRFNPDLNKTAPSMDDKGELQSLQWVVKKRLSLPHCVTAVQHVAFKLLASSFFLEVQRSKVLDDGSHSYECLILCKFENGTQHLRSLGKYLRRSMSRDFCPYFVIRGDANSEQGVILDFTSKVIDRIIDRADFNMASIWIVVEDEKKPSDVTLVLSVHNGLEPEGFSLSGFPKILANECTSRSPLPRTRKISSVSRRLDAAPSPSRSVRPARSTQDVTLDEGISLNGGQPGPKPRDLWAPSAGPLQGLRQADQAANAPEVLSRSGLPISYRDAKGPNRFWAYIGPQHMAKNRHLYSPATLEKFVPSVAAEPVELDAGEETEVKRVCFSELEGSAVQKKRTSLYHEVHGDSSPKPPQGSIPQLHPGKKQRDRSTSRSTPDRQDRSLSRSRPNRERKDSARDIKDAVSVTETIMGEYTIKFPAIPGFTPPPAFPAKRRGFDPGELEAAINAAFG